MSGYDALCRLSLEVAADMLESVAGLTAERVLVEIGFAVRTLDTSNPDELAWFACLCERRVLDLEGPAEVAT